MKDQSINSQEYWEKRFSDNWEASGGQSQTVFFTELISKLLPEKLVQEINDNEYSICDFGCGTGDSLPILKKLFPNNKIYGCDFSQQAVEMAKKSYLDFEFFQLDITKDNQEIENKYDVLICSNVVEHFKEEEEILEKLSKYPTKYMLILVPYREKFKSEEHEIVFTPNNIAMNLAKSTLVYADFVLDRQSMYFSEREILLIYKKENHNKTKFKLSNILNNFPSYEEENILLDEENAKLNNDIKFMKKENQDIMGNNEEILNTKQEILKNYDELKVYIDKLEGYKDKLEQYNATIEKNYSELSQQHSVFEKDLEKKEEEIGTLGNQIAQNEEEKIILSEKNKELKDLYDNLYAYSSNQDNKYVKLTQSKAFKFSMFIKRVTEKPYNALLKLGNKITALFNPIKKGDWNSFKYEVLNPFRKIRAKHVTKKELAKLNNRVKALLLNKRVIILPPTLDWHMPLFQRPQQLAKAYSKKKDTVVIYLTSNAKYDYVPYIEEIDNHLLIVNAEHIDDILSYIKAAKETIVSISWTVNKTYLDIIKPDYFIYEYIDELEIFHHYGEEMEIDHARFIKEADLTVATATKLFEQVTENAKNVVLSTNGGDYEFFSQTNEYSVNDKIKNEIEKYDCVLGYYGAVAKWFDYELVKEIAQKKPNWLWVIVGPNYDFTLDNSGILDISNIMYIDPQPYTELPGFLKGFTIATIPFVINEITLSTSPVKVFEYMASDTPILASAMPECMKYDSVYIYHTANEFIEKSEALMNLSINDNYWTSMHEEALANTWDAKTDEILEALYKNKKELL